MTMHINNNTPIGDGDSDTDALARAVQRYSERVPEKINLQVGGFLKLPVRPRVYVRGAEWTVLHCEDSPWFERYFSLVDESESQLASVVINLKNDNVTEMEIESTTPDDISTRRQYQWG